jgi:hypothetical protein
MHSFSLKLDQNCPAKPIRFDQSSGDLAPNVGADKKFNNKQATMVRKRRKTIKEVPTSAQPSSADEKDVILATYKKKNCLQPPPASRHRSVLKLDRVVPLFDMRSHTSSGPCWDLFVCCSLVTMDERHENVSRRIREMRI